MPHLIFFPAEKVICSLRLPVGKWFFLVWVQLKVQFGGHLFFPLNISNMQRDALSTLCAKTAQASCIHAGYCSEQMKKNQRGIFHFFLHKCFFQPRAFVRHI
jgi:hypothetical protein